MVDGGWLMVEILYESVIDTSICNKLIIFDPTSTCIVCDKNGCCSVMLVSTLHHPLMYYNGTPVPPYAL